MTASKAKNVKAVTDGNPNAIWNAEGFPPQWVEIDLGADSVVHHVTVIPEQTPPGHKNPGSLPGQLTLVDENGTARARDP